MRRQLGVAATSSLQCGLAAAVCFLRALTADTSPRLPQGKVAKDLGTLARVMLEKVAAMDDDAKLAWFERRVKLMHEESDVCMLSYFAVNNQVYAGCCLRAFGDVLLECYSTVGPYLRLGTLTCSLSLAGRGEASGGSEEKAGRPQGVGPLIAIYTQYSTMVAQCVVLCAFDNVFPGRWAPAGAAREESQEDEEGQEGEKEREESPQGAQGEEQCHGRLRAWASQSFERLDLHFGLCAQAAKLASGRTK